MNAGKIVVATLVGAVLMLWPVAGAAPQVDVGTSAAGEEWLGTEWGCYVYYDTPFPTYWEETNRLDGLQRDYTTYNGKSVPPDKSYGIQPGFWGGYCVLIGGAMWACGGRECPIVD